MIETHPNILGLLQVQFTNSFYLLIKEPYEISLLDYLHQIKSPTNPTNKDIVKDQLLEIIDTLAKNL